AAAPPRTAPQDEAIARALGLGRATLSESESKELLAAWGVESARERRANSAEAAVAAAEELGFPVALKVDSPDILHKTEAGVVRLNLRDMAQVRTAYAEILANAETYLSALPLDGGGSDRAGGNPTPSPLMGEGRDGGEFAAANAIPPRARITGVSVQEMVGDGVEVIIGVSRDPQLGPVLLFGSGGVMVEVYNDVALRRCPITRAEAEAMIAEVKGARLLRGFRGRPATDLAALADTLVRVSHFAMHLEGHLAELDINPLMVLPRGQGVKAVDALVVFRGT
ncbi:MAG: acetate--CoA ligase family protein, partial [Alphaproteobacteria bacterium]|nr:acetate--CoA ligase family protein [Alphaproteobacteria bacterium]